MSSSVIIEWSSKSPSTSEDNLDFLENAPKVRLTLKPTGMFHFSRWISYFCWASSEVSVLQSLFKSMINGSSFILRSDRTERQLRWWWCRDGSALLHWCSAWTRPGSGGCLLAVSPSTLLVLQCGDGHWLCSSSPLQRRASASLTAESALPEWNKLLLGFPSFQSLPSFEKTSFSSSQNAENPVKVTFVLRAKKQTQKNVFYLKRKDFLYLFYLNSVFFLKMCTKNYQFKHFTFLFCLHKWK